MISSRVEDLIRDNLTIPTLPEVVQRLNALIDDPESGTREIGVVVAEDAPLAAKVLRIANSAFYGLREQCLSAEQACSVLGVRVLRNVVAQAAVIRHFEHLRNHPGIDLDGIWRHAILTAQLCSYVAKQCARPLELTPEEFHVCGLLHDIGKIVLLDGLGENYLDVYQEASFLGEPLVKLERKQLGFDHTEVGAMVATRWGLPPAVSMAIHYHHGPRERVAESPVIALVAHANLVAGRAARGMQEEARRVFDAGTRAFLGLAAGAGDEIAEHALRSQTAIVV